MKSTSTQYGTVAVTIHWLSAALILGLLGSGFRAASLTASADKAAVLTAHVPMGALVLLLTVIRIAWWFFADKKPAPTEGGPAWQEKSAKGVHVLFYVVILGMAASGIGMMVLSAAGNVLFSAATTPLPDFQDYAPRIPHGIGARLMVFLFVVHAGAALYHHFVKRDGLLARMWYPKKAH